MFNFLKSFLKTKNYFSEAFFEELLHKHHCQDFILEAIRRYIKAKYVGPEQLYSLRDITAALTDAELINEFERRNLGCCDDDDGSCY